MTTVTDQRIRFVKMTGSGNDFIVIDNRDQIVDPDNCRDFVRLACRRKLSVGADGVILIENDPEVDFKWRFFNADGSEAEMCGNGARCAARFAYLKGIVKEPRLAFRTLAGIIEAEIALNRPKIRVTPPFGMEIDFCLDIEERAVCLHFINTGVPHVVCFLENEAALEAVDVFSWGRFLRYHPRFLPAGSNANFAFIRDSHYMAVRTYERGVEAETLACGTGSIAAALIAAAKRLVSSPVEVLTRSGETLTIYFDQTTREDGVVEFSDVYLEGEARVVYEAELWGETLRE
jgi:diaminopimelate epimerase